MLGKRRDGGGGVRLVPGLAVRAGQTIAGKYRVEELLGSGPAGVVLAARNVHLRQPVTLKVIASYVDGSEGLVERRLAKARLAARLHSVHVARILDIGVTEDGMPYIATEQLEGNTLEVELGERGPLPVEEAVRWVLEACEGLAEAHARGLVHGDLKPKNIFLAKPKLPERGRGRGRQANETMPMAGAPPQDPRVLKLLDFGTTSPLDAIGDEGGTAFFGSPAFVAPEQVQDAGSVDARADVWALGVLLYHLISGSLPFTADTVSGVIIAVVYDAPTLLTEAPYDLARLVHRCLEKDPAKRPRDVRELAEALAPFAGGRGGRLSERVGAMLDAPPVSAPSPLLSGGTTSAFAPVAASIAPRRGKNADTKPTPLAFDDERTSPSMRALARRRHVRSRALLGTLAVAATLALVGLAAPTLRGAKAAVVSNALASSAAVEAPSAAAFAEPSPVDVPAFVPSTEESASTTTVTSAELGEADAAVSFAPLRPEDVIPTPLALPAAPAVPVAVAERPPTLLPPPVTATSLAGSNTRSSTVRSAEKMPFRLPAGLPTTRDALSPSAPTTRASQRAGAGGGGASTTAASTTSTHTTDDTYLRRLFGEHDRSDRNK